MQKESIKFTDSVVFEGMTSIRAIIKSIDENISDRRIERILFDKNKFPKIAKEIGYLRAVSEKYGFRVSEESAEGIDKLSIGESHGGIIAIASERTIPCLNMDSDISSNGFYAMIDGIEDPYNFGYALRSLYAMGCDGIILAERNWMSAAGVVARSSAGASERFKIYKSQPADAAEIFKQKGYTVVCADLRTEEILGECEMKTPILLVVGGEKRGISKLVLSLADKLVKIDYGREFNASLSAASAITMFAYEIKRQNK